MKRHPLKWWKLAAPALLLAGLAWSGAAQAQKDDRFDGPGGMSAPSDPDDHMKDGGDRHGKSHGMRAHHGRQGRKGAMRRHRMDVMAQLDLSDRQKEQVKGIRQAQERRMIPLHASLQEAGLLQLLPLRVGE